MLAGTRINNKAMSAVGSGIKSGMARLISGVRMRKMDNEYLWRNVEFVFT
jgi:hypothetical protein